MILISFKIITLFLALTCTGFLFNQYVHLWIALKYEKIFSALTVPLILFCACFWALFVGAFL